MNCSLWWYFKHIERVNKELVRKNTQLESDKFSLQQRASLEEAYYDNSDSDEHQFPQKSPSSVLLPIIREERSENGQSLSQYRTRHRNTVTSSYRSHPSHPDHSPPAHDDHADDEFEILIAEAFQEENPVVRPHRALQIEGSEFATEENLNLEGSNSDDDRTSHTDHRSHRTVGTDHHRKSLIQKRHQKRANTTENIFYLLHKCVTETRDNIHDTYNSRVKIPDLSYVRRDECTVNDLWKEIDKLKVRCDVFSVFPVFPVFHWNLH